MSGVRFSKVVMVAIAAALSVAAQASAEDISAKRISIKDNADPAKRKVQVQSADVGVEFAEADDPATKGASIHVYSTTDNLCVTLPAGIDWESKNSVWKYKDKTTKNQAQIGDGKLKVKIRSGVSYTLADDGSQGPVNVQLQFGDGTRYCLRCSTPTRNDDKTYSAKECSAVPCDTEPPSACTPPPPATRCGDGNVDAGEDCEIDADCALGATCTDRCFCIDAQCPEAIEWTSEAGLATTTELDLGTAGFLHDAEVDDSTRLVLSVSGFSGAAPSCGVATIGGVNPREGNCRCASNTRILCDEPFVTDQNDCGGAVCDCYLSPPQPVSLGGTPACLLQRLSADVTGTWNVDTGSAQLTVPQRTKVYLGIDVFTPCPTCAGDAVANDGIRDGTCVGGQNDLLSCDANGSDATFPAPTGGGAYSYDCMPQSGMNVAGPGITSDHVLTTGSASLPLPQLTCANGFDLCTCRVCSGDSSLPCSSDTDCTAAGAGVCTGGGSLLSPNLCGDGTCTPDGGGEGTCNGGPDFSYCDGVVRANGQGLLACNSNVDCEPLIPGTGNCTIVELQKCFLDTIGETGSASTSVPVLASAYCMATSTNGSFNTLAGLPGPVKTRLEGTTVFPCAGTPGSDYPGCP